jgi:hypothetical protein
VVPPHHDVLRYCTVEGEKSGGVKVGSEAVGDLVLVSEVHLGRNLNSHKIRTRTEFYS